jgi:hypothetical protein
MSSRLRLCGPLLIRYLPGQMPGRTHAWLARAVMIFFAKPRFGGQKEESSNQKRSPVTCCILPQDWKYG